MAQRPAGFVPDGFVPDSPSPAGFVPDGFVPDARPPDFSARNEVDDEGNATVAGLSKFWQAANSPLLPQIAEAAHAIEEYMSRPSLGDAELNERIPGLGTVSAMARGGGAGIIGGIGDVASSFTSPFGIALTLAGLGDTGIVAKEIPRVGELLKLPAVRNLQRAVQGIGGAMFGAHGAQEVVTNPTLAGKARGVAEFASGALGAASAMRKAPGTTPTPAQSADQAANRAALGWADREGLPVDAGTATGNRFVRGAQYVLDRTLGGSIAGTGREQRKIAAIAEKGSELADRARSVAVTPEQAGESTRQALGSKSEAHGALADRRYEQLREAENDPANRMAFPTAPKPVDKLPEPLRGQLRRIVHEMDASGHTPGKLVSDEPGVGSGTTYIHRTGGAKVYDDITQALGYEPTRGEIQTQLEEYLGGGEPTAAVKAAMRVAEQRQLQRAGSRSTVSLPELAPSEMGTPTRLEKTRVTSEEIGLPVDNTLAKKAIKPLADQMERQMPITQQQANPGLKALRNILDGPDYAPLSQVDRDLSAIKAIARQQGGLAKFAAKVLDDAVKKAAANGGPAVVRMLEEARQAHLGKVGTDALIEQLPGGPMQEPVAIYKRATGELNSGLEFLRKLQKDTPQVIPQMARALLDELLAMTPGQMQTAWAKRGMATKRILFPEAGQVEALDHYFRAQKLLQENLNPSGSGVHAQMLAEVATGITNPPYFIATEVGAAGLSKILHSKAGVRALTKLLGTELQAAKAPRTSPATFATAARTAGWAELIAAARAVGVPLAPPALAVEGKDQPTTRR